MVPGYLLGLIKLCHIPNPDTFNKIPGVSDLNMQNCGNKSNHSCSMSVENVDK